MTLPRLPDMDMGLLISQVRATVNTLCRVAEGHNRVAAIAVVRLDGGEIRVSECLASLESDLACPRSRNHLPRPRKVARYSGSAVSGGPDHGYWRRQRAGWHPKIVPGRRGILLCPNPAANARPAVAISSQRLGTLPLNCRVSHRPCLLIWSSQSAKDGVNQREVTSYGP